MALLLAVGSPSLLIYSLAVTLLQARWTNRIFRPIVEKAGPLGRNSHISAIKAARAILMELQHIPIGIRNGTRREIAQLVVRPENGTWWCRLRQGILKTKREWTYSLYAQVGFVCAAQLLAIISFFTSLSSDWSTSIGIGLAINCLWLWMIPVVLGWVYVGTQTSAGSVKASLTETTVPALEFERNLSGDCYGIRDRTFFDEVDTSYQYSSAIKMRKLSEDSQSSTATTGFLPETFMGFSIAGDELEPGPIFNYARPWTHANAVKHIAVAFKQYTRRQLKKQPVATGRTWDPDPELWTNNLQGSPEEYSEYINPEGKDVIDFSVHAPASAALNFNCITAAFVAVFLQWGTTGGAIVIAFE